MSVGPASNKEKTTVSAVRDGREQGLAGSRDRRPVGIFSVYFPKSFIEYSQTDHTVSRTGCWQDREGVDRISPSRVTGGHLQRAMRAISSAIRSHFRSFWRKVASLVPEFWTRVVILIDLASFSMSSLRPVPRLD
jgi:hypothetical protein